MQNKKKKNCDKRHPKLCKKYLLEEFCKFGQECHYQHKEKDKSEEHKLKERIEELEKVVKEKAAAESLNGKCSETNGNSLKSNDPKSVIS